MKVLLHSFNMGDVEDVDVYVAEPILQWQQTEQGLWAMTHANDLKYNIVTTPETFGYCVDITGDIPDGTLVTEYLLKYKHHAKSLSRT